MIDDKFQQHYRQQMSALMDGELAPDQARFLMRRMAEDSELNDTWERWQLCGDVLRGRAQAPAPQGFAERVAAAIAAQSVQPAANQEFRRPRNRLLRWGGGAIAASVALVALFMAGQQTKPQASAPASELASVAPVLNSGTPPATPVAPVQTPAADAGAALAGTAVAVASLPRRADDSRRGSATRNQQAARATASITQQALAAVNAPPARAASAEVAATQDPFAGAHLGQAAARPWPRANLPQFRAGGAYSAGYAPGEQAPYYPFQPRLSESPASATPPASTPQP
ncbi:anti sigma-E protein, RseA [Pseudoxanthomonas sp. GM95]|uniref:sigma-E factor negative regulatory protein n=1 Tax=Pseudoxanthomonas sp. GM95 TaxID=1881043 RepID=UPI0008AAACDD|nr:sigma-E factor negative regulatory protein [Pseudoxanthomonas sp. GM95]SEK75109.1 anti sigma-E protein, RseA [Pseudoxanthomonas sp. GM95]